MKNAAYQTIYDGIQRGLSVDEACDKALKRKGRKDARTKYFVGKRSLRHYCMQNGLNYHAVLRKVRSGTSIEKALRSK